MQAVSYAASAIIGNKAERAGSRKKAAVSGWGFAKGNGLPTMMDKKYEEYALMFEKSSAERCRPNGTRKRKTDLPEAWIIPVSRITSGYRCGLPETWFILTGRMNGGSKITNNRTPAAKDHWTLA